MSLVKLRRGRNLVFAHMSFHAVMGDAKAKGPALPGGLSVTARLHTGRLPAPLAAGSDAGCPAGYSISGLLIHLLDPSGMR